MARLKLNTGAGKSPKAGKSSEKELQKLRRMDLLELLISQIRENEQQAAELEELRDLSERLKAKLNDKDAQIARLVGKLDAKDAEIEKLHEVNRATAHASGLLGVREMIDIERFAVEEYLKQVGGKDER